MFLLVMPPGNSCTSMYLKHHIMSLFSLPQCVQAMAEFSTADGSVKLRASATPVCLYVQLTCVISGVAQAKQEGVSNC